MEEPLLLSRQGAIAVVTLNRPQARNALDEALRGALAGAMRQLDADDGVRAIVVTGAGDRAFCAGLDVKEAQRGSADTVEASFGSMLRMYEALRALGKPLVAAVNGAATGSGFQIPLCADIRIGCPATRMGQSEINVGMPSIMGAFFMSLYLSHADTVELSLTGRILDAAECLERKLLHRLVPVAELMPAALEVAGVLAAKPPTAMRVTKQRFRDMTQAAFDAAARAAVPAQQACYRSGEPQRIMAEFARR